MEIKRERGYHAVAIILSFLILGAFLYAIVDFLVLPLFSEVNKLLVSLPPLTAQSDGDWGFFFNQQTKDALPSNLQTLIDSALSLATSHAGSKPGIYTALWGSFVYLAIFLWNRAFLPRLNVIVTDCVLDK